MDLLGIFWEYFAFWESLGNPLGISWESLGNLLWKSSMIHIINSIIHIINSIVCIINSTINLVNWCSLRGFPELLRAELLIISTHRQSV